MTHPFARFTLSLTLAALMLAMACAGAHASPAALETHFGQSGVLPLGVDADNDGDVRVVERAGGTFAVATIPDTDDVVMGDICTVHGCTVPGATPTALVVKGYLESGRRDPAFGTHGTATIQTGLVSPLLLDAQPLPNGDTLVALLGLANAKGQLDLVALTEAGALDTTFGSGGIARTPYAIPKSPFVYNPFDDGTENPAATRIDMLTEALQDLQAGLRATLAIAPDGSFALATSNDFVVNQYSIERFTANGAVDASFGRGGQIVVHSETNGQGSAVAPIAYDPQGRLYDAVVPHVKDRLLGTTVRIERLTSGGGVDTTFGGATGVTTASNPKLYEAFTGMTTDTQGDIVVGTEHAPATPQSFITGAWQVDLTRIAPSGALDAGFDANATDVATTTTASPGASGSPVLLPSGDVLIVVSDPDGALLYARAASGAADTAFDTDGATPITLPAAYGASLVVRPPIVATDGALDIVAQRDSISTDDYILLRMQGGASAAQPQAEVRYAASDGCTVAMCHVPAPAIVHVTGTVDVGGAPAANAIVNIELQQLVGATWINATGARVATRADGTFAAHFARRIMTTGTWRAVVTAPAGATWQRSDAAHRTVLVGTQFTASQTPRLLGATQQLETLITVAADCITPASCAQMTTRAPVRTTATTDPRPGELGLVRTGPGWRKLRAILVKQRAAEIKRERTGAGAADQVELGSSSDFLSNTSVVATARVAARAYRLDVVFRLHVAGDGGMHATIRCAGTHSAVVRLCPNGKPPAIPLNFFDIGNYNETADSIDTDSIIEHMTTSTGATSSSSSSSFRRLMRSVFT